MIEISPVATVDAKISVPGSKSFTQRALIAAALAKGTTVLLDPLISDDTNYLADALMQLGVKIEKEQDRWRVIGTGGAIAAGKEPLYLGNNGTATRFLASVAALGHTPCRIEGDAYMAGRPIEPLLQALRGWGVNISSVHGTGCPPLQIEPQKDKDKGGGIVGGETVLPKSGSSQYLSSLLLAAPYAQHPAILRLETPPPSRPYVAMTLAVMHDFGITVDCTEDYRYFSIPQGLYEPRQYQIEGDASNASYFWAAAAICSGRVVVKNVRVPSLQGDIMFASLLGRMGCIVEQTEEGLAVTGGKRLQAIDIDMGDMPDVAPTLAVVAAFAAGRTTLRNIGHLRIKECDRLAVVAENLQKIGVRVEEGDDSLAIHGTGGDCSQLHGAELATHDDHRMAMCFSLAGLKIPQIKILGDACVAKSFPDYWQRFSLLTGVPCKNKK